MTRLSDAIRKEIRQIFQKTGSIRTTAKLTGVSRNAVRRELRAMAMPQASVDFHFKRSAIC
jgi:IS30 family transposase